MIAARLASAYVGHLLSVRGRWYVWDGHRWARADRGEPTRAVLDTMRAILADPTTTPGQRADVDRCSSAAAITAILRLAAALSPLAGTTADLAGPEPTLERAPGTRWAMACDTTALPTRTTLDATGVTP